MKNNYSLLRIYKIFILLLSFFLLIKKKPSFLWFRPLPPKEMRKSIIVLGASFIKLAQVLATRADFFDEEYLEELKRLHDELPPMEEKEFESVFTQAFKKNPFAYFDKTPIASASIGQVHRAVLKNGKEVAVKLRRFGIEKRIRSDIKILRSINFIFRPLFSEYTKNSIEAVINEFADMIVQEVDLSRELYNLKKFSKTYAHCNILFPTPYEENCSEDALVMSYMDGVRFDDKKALKELGIDFHPILERLINFYAEQMLVVGLFHADPHPGNLLVDKKENLILLDFGMVKRIDNETRIAIIEMIKSAYEKNYDLYITSAKRLGVIAYEAPKAAMAELVENMFEIFSDEHLSAINMQRLAFELLESMRDLPFKLPQEAIYILRASAIIEGLGTTYIENFNGVKDILPILQKNIPRALGYKDSLFEMILEEIKESPYVAKDFKTTIKKASEGNLQVEMSPLQIEWLKKETKEYLRPIVLSFAVMLLAIMLVELGGVWQGVGVILFAAAFLKLLFIS
ncbi:Predicted unusual protein kinase regulating ubiquinone biosynthesis, AarF/ABC1/UbiB family [Nitratiruptor tergarcus DSM 16512]|uniref:Predicted unusual protein kinase regulating ubiquinone biosynthesis, AarF/ABC1/UbiB family n=2 Tax=Nitratiruptor tergarcus TaxID=269259 RepID=A0A1W1WT59_9BACT|nr:AarF/UbiB family protein [Nitratiruptor tergarcus]SMC09385.1 Predicted unusual protein kinase regulating ubiquinone biosynthesis, AarF/ABC1/UbiB family [Nitratiruptor tergarcus DSM 16512]